MTKLKPHSLTGINKPRHKLWACAISTTIICGTLSIASTTSLASTLVNQSSSLAILTDKEGIAARLAHRHIIVASSWNGTITLQKHAGHSGNALNSLKGGDVHIELKVNDLIVDSPDAAQAIIPTFENTNYWNTAKDQLEPANAADVRTNMLDESQLHSKAFPEISGKGIFNDCQVTESKSLSCTLHLTLKIRDKSVVKQAKINITQDGHHLSTSLVVPYKFTEFGIKPYKALLGAIAVKDDFVLGMKLSAID